VEVANLLPDAVDKDGQLNSVACREGVCRRCVLVDAPHIDGILDGASYHAAVMALILSSSAALLILYFFTFSDRIAATCVITIAMVDATDMAIRASSMWKRAVLSLTGNIP
jgi:hypothetical protein